MISEKGNLSYSQQSFSCHSSQFSESSSLKGQLMELERNSFIVYIGSRIARVQFVIFELLDHQTSLFKCYFYTYKRYF